ncbi:ABC transporter permease [Haladaptatus sp. AB643]|uniref:ABC transporter permease n=1 Tax=Haladaptatus sp. AB643 TaxID=2934174 RepID=UPI00209C681A|nr:ABC transporter permease [Haladaptatus sp. AB643]MCO8246381.1 ABC transporter permease [Haladaptatus sp. AB643]
MSLRLVARKDFLYFARKKSFWAVSAVLTLLVVLWSYFYTIHSYSTGTAVDVVQYVYSAAQVLVPLIGLFVGYSAVAAERESGTMKLLLGLPHSRRDVFGGKFISRCGVALIPSLASFLLAVVFIVSQFGRFSLGPYALFTAATVLLGAVYVAIGVGLSGLAKSNRCAGILAVGAFALFQLFWGMLVNIVAYLKTGSSMKVAPYPAWTYLVKWLSPSGAYEGLLHLSLLPPLRIASGGQSPAYLSPWLFLVVLLVWGIVPLAVGYWRFENAELD